MTPYCRPFAVRRAPLVLYFCRKVRLMEKPGTRIKEIRKQKGLTQQQLAEATGLNLRTIQRVESGQTIPRGHTLQALARALECTPVDLNGNSESTGHEDKPERLFHSVVLHLSVLSFIVLPLGNIIFPTIIWLQHRSTVAHFKEMGRRLLNFQITWTVVTYLCIGVYGFSKIMHQPVSDVFMYAAIALYSINIGAALVMAIIARKNPRKARYPSLVPFIKEKL